MRFVVSLALLFSACAHSAAGAGNAAPSQRALSVAVNRPSEIALFVRDRTAMFGRLADPLKAAFESRGIHCKLVRTSQNLTDPWTVDAALARAEKISLLVRVRIETRTRLQSALHQQIPSSRPATGLVIGPWSESEGTGSSISPQTGGLEAIDVGRTQLAESLDISAAASLHRVDGEDAPERWMVSEGSMLVRDPNAPKDRDDWDLIYRALADNIADRVAKAIATAR